MEAATKLSEIPSAKGEEMQLPIIPIIPKFAVPDTMTGDYCFVVPASQLIYDNTGLPQWKWDYFQETSNMLVDIAELTSACFINVHGKFKISDLSENSRYEVVFVVMLRDFAQGWDHRPVKFELKLPADTMRPPLIEDLSTKPKEEWVEINIGEFVPGKQVTDNEDIMEFSLSTPWGPWTSKETIPIDEEMRSWPWMSGLVIKSVIIRPINDFHVPTDKQFSVIPRDLTLFEGNRQEKKWHWYCILEQKRADVQRDTFMEVVRLDGAYILKVDGHFNTRQLQLDILYQVVFVVKLTESAPEWDRNYPLILQVKLPDGTKLESHQYTPDKTWKKPDEWKELVAGEFRPKVNNEGELQFSLTQPKGSLKKGLVIKGVLIRSTVSP